MHIIANQDNARHIFDALPDDVRAILMLFDDSWAFNAYFSEARTGFVDLWHDKVQVYGDEGMDYPDTATIEAFCKWVREGMKNENP